MKKLLLILTAAVALLSACDSLEDTYKDLAGDGPIRYPGKCTDITVTPGWECLRINWTISNDPAIKNIVVTCVSETDSVYKELEPTATSCTIDNLKDENYTVKVQSKAADGMLSIADAKIERPYTYEHEAVIAYTRGFTKSYLCKNHLLLIMSNWEEGIERFWISYTATDGKSAETDLTKEMFDEKYVDLEGVDTSKPVVLHRRASIAGCPDVIDFEPFTITKNVVFNTDFQKNINERYGVSADEQASFVETAQELEIDNNLMSFEDLLYFTKLKKLAMGKNHFFNSKYIVYPTVEDTKTSKWVLEKLNEIYGTVVEQYGDSYFGGSWTADFVEKKENSTLPAIDYLDTAGWSITNEVEDTRNEDLGYLIDNDLTTTWSSWPSLEGIRTMALVIDLAKEQNVKGLKIVQAANTETANYQPSSVIVEYSTDKANWKKLTHSTTNTIGSAQGESTLLNSAHAVQARYVRVSMQEISYKGQVKVSLAEISVY